MNRQRKKISVVISIYQVEAYLDKCIQSVRNQTYERIEIVLVVRDSIDRCLAICKFHKEEDDRIVLVHQKGKGLVNARKEGTLSASGDYVIHMDGDDWVDEDWLEKVAVHLEDYDSDMVYLPNVREENKHQTRESYVENFDVDALNYEEIFPMLIDTEECFRSKIRCSTWCWVVKKNLLMQQQMLIDDTIYMAEDVVYVFMCLLKAKKVTVVYTGYYHYLIREGSGCRTPVGIKEGNLEGAYRILKNNYERCGGSGRAARCLTMFVTRAACCHEYSAFGHTFDEYLYPYAKVKSGSSVLVYGAGRFGRQVVETLADRRDYRLAGWTDRDIRKTSCKGRVVRPIEDTLGISYDYIVVAVISRKLALEIRDNLLHMGVPDEKIALMDASVITEDMLPWMDKGKEDGDPSCSVGDMTG